MFPSELMARAAAVIAAATAQNLRLTTAESCTGGLVAALLTEIAGSSTVFGFGFVTYANEAKMDLLAVPGTVFIEYGAVSRQCAVAMAEGALSHAGADLAVSITGIAGPGGGTPEKPVGLVHFGLARRDAPTIHRERRFGDQGRGIVRRESVREALSLFEEALGG